MLFKDIIGQEHVKQTFIKMIDGNHLPHAILLSGPQGSGKLALAIALAQYVCCKNRHDGNACGECPSCRQFQKLAHPDLHFVFPITRSSDSITCDKFLPQWREMVLKNPYFRLNQWTEKINSDNKQAVIYANESDSIIKKLNETSFEDGYKCMIIWLVEKMNNSCANKLLKIFEEPPKKTLFIMISEEPDALLSTIISRTQRINIPALTETDIVQAFSSKYSLSEDELKNIAHIANGDITKAEEIIKASGENQEYFELFVSIMRASYSRQIRGMREWTEDMAKIGRKRQVAFLAYAQKMIRENFIFNLKRKELNYMTKDESNFSIRFAPFVNEKNVFGLLSELEYAERHIEQNVQAKLVFFDLSMKLTMLLKNK